MRKTRLLMCIFVLCLITGCSKKEEEIEEATIEITTEAASENVTTETETEEQEIIAQGEGGGVSQTATDAETETEETLPATMEPLDNDDKINPSFTGLDAMQYEHFDRAAILDAVLSYMYKEGISEDVCTNINIDQNNSYRGIAYKATITFESNGDRTVALIGNNGRYEIQPYINAEETDITPDD